MKPNDRLRLLAAIVSLTLALAFPSRAQNTDRVLTNGYITTVTSPQLWAEWIAISANKVSYMARAEIE